MEERRLRRIFLVLLLQITIWVSANCRPFGSDDVAKQTFSSAHPPVLTDRSIQPAPQGWAGNEEREEGYVMRGMGSSPPSCENKCYGCVPCQPIKVPTISHASVQYTNYEPEGWRCKCGPSFYSP